MFEALDDEQPVAPGPSHRDEVARRARSLSQTRVRRRNLALAGTAVAVVLAVGLVAAVRSGGGTDVRPVAGPAVGPSARHSHSAPTLGRPGTTATPGFGAYASGAAAGQATANGDQSATCTTPSFAAGSYCGLISPGGKGTGPGGRCLSTEGAAPCGPGVVVGRFYPATVITGCSQPVTFDGRRWRATSAIPGPRDATIDGWLRLEQQGTVELVSVYGSSHLAPAAGKSSACEKARSAP